MYHFFEKRFIRPIRGKFKSIKLIIIIMKMAAQE